MLVSILIPTLFERTSVFIPMVEALFKQIKDNDLEKKVEIISICDNRNMTLPAKRNKLQEMASGKYFTHLDDDDNFTEEYCKTITDFIETLEDDVDVIGYNQKAYVEDDIFIVRSSQEHGLQLTPSGNQFNEDMSIKEGVIPEVFRTPWQWCLWNRERFGKVYRSDADGNGAEDQNWLVRVHLEYPKTYKYIDFIAHEYHFEDPTKTTCQ